ncbi:MAG: ribosome maturation factor RimM [Actinomycetota bacterium]|nr:ribosome maturation factor RimM [Actinomycetota bacterium]
MEDFSDPVVIGVIGAPHGVSGTVRVRPTGSGNHLREDIEPFVDGVRRRILRVRETPKGFLVDLEGFAGRPDAKSLRGKELFLDRSELDEPDEDEVYVSDLMGLRAVDESGNDIGAVAETFETPAHEILVVRGESETGEAREYYVPFTLEHVPEVDLDGGRIVIRVPEE